MDPSTRSTAPLSVADSGIASTSVPYVQWTPVVAGAIAAAACSSVLMTFGSAIGLAVSSPSSTWRDASASLALLSGVWILLVAVGSFALGGYIAGKIRSSWIGGTEDEIEFRDGVHGLLSWGLAIFIGAILAVAAANVAATARTGRTTPVGNGSATEPLIALELDRLFRSDRNLAEPAMSEARAEAARIISTGLGRHDIRPEDRAYLVRLVATRTGLSPTDAERRATEVIAQAKEATSQARRSSVILAFMTAAALAVAAVAAWLAAHIGGRHRDRGPVPPMRWRRRQGFVPQR